MSDLAELDAGHSIRHFASDELDAAQGRFMVEQDAARGMHAKTLAVVHRHPVGLELGDRTGRARIEGRSLALPRLLDHPKHLRGGGLIEPRVLAGKAHRLKRVHAADCGHIGGEQRLLPGRLHEGLCTEIVDFLRLHVAQDANQARQICQE